jgi:hypothetical protein
LLPLFATGVNDTGGKFAAGVVDTGGNLPPVSTTLAKMMEKFATGINNASENGGKICHWCRRYRWCTLTREYLREFLEKFETV